MTNRRARRHSCRRRNPCQGRTDPSVLSTMLPRGAWVRTEKKPRCSCAPRFVSRHLCCAGSWLTLFLRPPSRISWTLCQEVSCSSMLPQRVISGSPARRSKPEPSDMPRCRVMSVTLLKNPIASWINRRTRKVHFASGALRVGFTQTKNYRNVGICQFLALRGSLKLVSLTLHLHLLFFHQPTQGRLTLFIPPKLRRVRLPLGWRQLWPG